jgi:hypothetical protein
MTRTRRILTAMVGGAAVALTVFGSASTAAASTTSATRESSAVTAAAAWEWYSFYYTRNDCVQVGRDGVTAGWWDAYKCVYVRGDRWDLYVQR